MFRTLGEKIAVSTEAQAAKRRARRAAKKNMAAMKNTVARNYELVAQPAREVRPRLKATTVAGRRAVQLKIDVPLLLTVITLVIYGLVMVYSASYDFSYFDEGNYTAVFLRQVLWVAVGIVGAVCLMFLDYHYWRQFAVPAMAVTILLLIGVLIVNETRLGAVRALFSGRGQPSELAKLMTIVYLAVWLDAKRDQIKDINFGLVPLAAILGLLGGLIVLQPDLSAVVTIFFLGGLLFFLAGGDLRQIGILLVLAVLIGYLIFVLYPTGSSRISDYLAGLRDPTEASYHIRRSYEAFVKGGWFGVGIGKGETKLTGLPVPHTDSIFAVVGEESGVLGSAAMIALFTVFLWRGMVICRRAPDALGALLAAGLTLWISIEAFINMAVMVNLLPFAGNALPFISAGGSNLIVSLAAVGVLMNIARQSEKKKEENGKFTAVVNLRRWNRRRSVSSPRRPARPARTSGERG